MNIEFIPYEEALELKELGFDEKCLAYYKDNELYQEAGVAYVNSDFGETLVWDEMLPNKNCTAPLYQQAFRWFREKYSLYHCIIPNKSVYDNYVTGIFYIEVLDSSGKNHAEYDDNEYFYEEAELACLKKLIEIVKNKQQ